MSGHVVGIDLGGTHTQIGVVDAANRIVGHSRPSTPASAGLDAVVATLRDSVRAACDQHRIASADLAAVGIGAPSPIDSTHRIVLNAVNLRWRDVPLADLVSKSLGGVPTTLDNDVNVAVWGEFNLGAAVGYRNVLGVWVGTGVGGGLVLEGRLHHGTFGTAGEIGHTIVNPAGGPATSSLEQLAARSSMVAHVCDLIRANRPSMIAEMVNGDLAAITMKHIAKAVGEGDDLTTAVAQHSAEMVGLAAANAATLLSLDCIVLGGGATEALGRWYVDRVRSAFDRAVFPEAVRACAIVETKLRDNAGLLGAALLARERFGVRGQGSTVSGQGNPSHPDLAPTSDPRPPAPDAP